MRHNKMGNSGSKRDKVVKHAKYHWILLFVIIFVIFGVVFSLIIRSFSPYGNSQQIDAGNASDSPNFSEVPRSTGPLIPRKPSSATENISEDGFSIELDGVELSAGPYVVSSPAQITASLSGDIDGVYELSDGVLTPTGEAVEVEFSDGRQPEDIVDIVFDLSEADTDFGDSQYPIVMSEDEGGNVELIDSSWNPEAKTITAHTKHFTKFSVMLADFNRAIDSFNTGIQQALSMRFDPPSCYSTTEGRTANEIIVGSIRGQMVWPCISEKDGLVVVSLHSNSPLVWGVSSEQGEYDALPVATSAAGIIALAVHEQIGAYDSLGAVVPGGHAQFTIDEDSLPATVTLDALHAEMVSHVLAQAVQSIPGVKLIHTIGWAECAYDALESSLDEDNISQLVKAILGCLGQAAPGIPGVVVSLLATTPAVIAGSLSSALGEMTDGNRISFEISKSYAGVADGVLPDGWTGVWQGPATGYQDWYDVRVTLEQINKQVIGQIEYPELRCGGSLTYVGSEAGTIHMIEDITFGGQCVERGDVWLWMDAGTLRFKYQAEGDSSRTIQSKMVRPK